MRYERQRTPTATESLFRISVFPLFRLFWRPSLPEGRYLPIEKPCFIYGNHGNNFDPFVLNIFTRWGDSTAGVLTQEYFRGRIHGKAMRGLDLLPTRKHVPEPHLIRQLYQKIQDRRSIVIYPEGGRRWDGRPLPWIESTAKIFVKSGVPVYPIITKGSYASWPRWATYPRPARLDIEVMEPFVFDRKTPFEEALAKLKAPMDFDESIVSDENKPKWAFRPADGIHRLLYRDPDTGENGGLFTPDGTYVVNRAGTIRYKMLPDSSLLDEKTGRIRTTGELHAIVKELPLERDAGQAYIQNAVEMHLEDAFPNLKPHGRVTATLYEDAISIKGTKESWTLPLDKILHAGVERSHKLQLFQSDRMIQLSFLDDGSALQWQETLARMKTGSGTQAAPDSSASRPAASL